MAISYIAALLAIISDELEGDQQQALEGRLEEKLFGSDGAPPEGFYISAGAPPLLLRDLFSLVSRLRRRMREDGWDPDVSCTGATEHLALLLTERGWSGFRVIDGAFLRPGRHVRDGTGHDWVVVTHEGGRYIVDAVVAQFYDRWGDEVDDSYYHEDVMPSQRKPFGAQQQLPLPSAPPLVSDLPTTYKAEVTHVGDEPRQIPPLRYCSYESRGLSVSEHPEEWAEIARLPGEHWQLRRADNKAGTFVLMTLLSADAKDRLCEVAGELGLLRWGPLWRVRWYDSEDETYRHFDFLDQEQAEAELQDLLGSEGEMLRVQVWLPTDRLERRWAQCFRGRLDPSMAIDVALLEVIEAAGLHDGAWWQERLEPEMLSAPRGVIFQSQLAEWTWKLDRPRLVGPSDLPDVAVSLECTRADDLGAGHKNEDDWTDEDRDRDEDFGETMEDQLRLQELVDASGLNAYVDIRRADDERSRRQDCHVRFNLRDIARVNELLEEAEIEGQTLNLPVSADEAVAQYLRETYRWTVERSE